MFTVFCKALNYLGVFYANEEEDWETAVHYFRQAAKHKVRLII